MQKNPALLDNFSFHLRQAQVIEGSGQKVFQIFPPDPIFWGQRFPGFQLRRSPKMRIDDQEIILRLGGIFSPGVAALKLFVFVADVEAK